MLKLDLSAYLFLFILNILFYWCLFLSSIYVSLVISTSSVNYVIIVFCNIFFFLIFFFLYLKTLQVLLLQISHLILPPCHYCGFKTFLPFCVGICRQTKPFLLFMLWWAPTFHMDTAWWEVLFIYVFLIIHYCFLEKKIIFFTRAVMKTIPLRSKQSFLFLCSSL